LRVSIAKKPGAAVGIEGRRHLAGASDERATMTGRRRKDYAPHPFGGMMAA
jgi:hypothetical protein